MTGRALEWRLCDVPFRLFVQTASNPSASFSNSTSTNRANPSDLAFLIIPAQASAIHFLTYFLFVFGLR